MQRWAQFQSPVISFAFLLSVGKLFQQAAGRAQKPGMQFAYLLEAFLQILIILRCFAIYNKELENYDFPG